MQDGAIPHTTKETIWTLCSVFGELNGDDRIISKGLWSYRSPDLNPLFLFVGKSQNCYIHQQSTRPGGSITEYLRSNLQHSAMWTATCFPKCLKEFRQVSQQGEDILNIFYDGE
jgi:hypothetical protein